MMNINGVVYVQHLIQSYSLFFLTLPIPIPPPLLLHHIHYFMQDEWQYRGNETIVIVGS